MKFNIFLKFFENDNKINFNSIPDTIQKEILDSFKQLIF